MQFIKCTRPKDVVLMVLMLDRTTKKYRFVNLTHPHICECQFLTIEDAMVDLNKEVDKGHVLYYEFLNLENDAEDIISTIEK